LLFPLLLGSLASSISLPPPRILHRPYSLLTFMNAAPLHSINSAVISQQSHPTQTDHPFSMQPMHIRLPWFSDQDKIRRHSWIEAARLTLISVPSFTQATQPWSLSPVTHCSATVGPWWKALKKPFGFKIYYLN
jgi:hypothetical protein